MNSVVETDNLKAKIKVMDKQNKDFQPICYLRPSRCNYKTIRTRNISFRTRYLELLHGLNLAKLKLQDNEMSSNLKAIDLHFILYRPTLLKEQY
jgi:hypothetical protein